MLRIVIVFVIVCFVFSTQTTQRPPYEEHIAAKMIQLSTVIYDVNKKGFTKGQCIKCNRDFDLESIVETDNQLAIVGHDPKIKSIIVAFRGTQNRDNRFMDADIIFKRYPDQTKCPDCLIHAGFLRCYNSLQRAGLNDRIKEAIRKYPNERIIFTGHSLGGAIAQLAAIRLTELGALSQVKTVTLYTLGQPRVGNTRFSFFVNRLIPDNNRMIHNGDMVPHKPTSQSPLGLQFAGRIEQKDRYYVHAGRQIWYTKDMQKVISYCDNDSKQCSNSLKNTDYRIMPDHSSNQYIKLYERLKEQIRNSYEL